MTEFTAGFEELASDGARQGPRDPASIEGLEVALEARETLEAEGRATRVVSLPSWYLFQRQSSEYRDEVLGPPATPRVSKSGAPRRRSSTPARPGRPSTTSPTNSRNSGRDR